MRLSLGGSSDKGLTNVASFWPDACKVVQARETLENGWQWLV